MEAYELVMATMDSLMADRPGVQVAQRLDQLLRGTDHAVEAVIAMQLAFMSGISGKATPTHLVAAESAMRDMLHDEIHRFVIASGVATYRSFSDDELNRYVDFVATAEALKFYALFNRSLLDILVPALRDAGASFAQAAREVEIAQR